MSTALTTRGTPRIRSEYVFGDLQARLDAHTAKAGPDDCWEWQAATNDAGYGVTWTGERTVLAHRAAYKLNTGANIDGKVVRHTCDNPPCVNPAHLIIGSHGDNINDKVERGRHTWAHSLEWRQMVADRYEPGSSVNGIRAMAREFGMSPSLLGRIVRATREGSPTYSKRRK